MDTGIALQAGIVQSSYSGGYSCTHWNFTNDYYKSFVNTLVTATNCNILFVGSRALALADPYCHIAWNSVGLLVRERSAARTLIVSQRGFLYWFASAQL